MNPDCGPPRLIAGRGEYFVVTKVPSLRTTRFIVGPESGNRNAADDPWHHHPNIENQSIQPTCLILMKTRKHTAAQTPKELLTDLQSLVSDAEKMAGDAVSEHTSEAMEALRSRYDAAHERLGVIYEGARKRAIAGAKYTDEAVRENPYQAIAITAGVALLAGVLIGRRTR